MQAQTKKESGIGTRLGMCVRLIDVLNVEIHSKRILNRVIRGIVANVVAL